MTSGEPEHEPAPSGRVAWLEFGLLAAVALWLFRDVLLFGQVYYVRDIHLVWHAQIEGFVRAIAAGSWPVWNPGLAFGRPLLADPGAQVLYPLTWLNLVLSPWTYYTLFVAAHFLVAATGMRALARRYGLSRAPAFLAAVAFAASGPVLGILDLWHHFAGACLMPWVVEASDRALAGERRGVARLGLLLALQVLAGSADLVAITLCLSAALGAARRTSWGAGRPARAAGAAVLRVAGGVVLALGLSAALWMPALEALGGTARTELPGGVRTYWSLHPLASLETVLPGLVSALPLNQAWRAELFESREPFLGSLYLGAGMLALVGAAAASSHPLRVALLAALAVAGLVALGSHTPVYATLTTLVPPLRILRYPVKVMTAVAFCWSLLAGLGADAWGRDALPRRRIVAWSCVPPAVALVAASALALAAWLQYDTLASLLLDPALGQAGRDRLLPQVLSRLLVPAVLAVAALGLAWAHATARVGGARVALALSVLAALDLLVYHRSASPVAPVALYTLQPEVVAVLREAGAKRVYVYDYSPSSTIRTLQTHEAYRLARMPGDWPLEAAGALALQMYLAPESAGRFGLAQAYAIDYRGLYPLALERLTRLLRDLETTPSHLRLLQLGGVERVIALHDVPGLVPERSIDGLFERPIRLMRVPDALPRSYVVGAARAEESDALAPLLDSSFDPRREVVLGGVDRSGPAGFHGTSRIVEERADRVLLETEASAPGFAVLLDGFDQGWLARLDGEPAPVLRANAVFRAVAVPQGRHSVEFVYRPRGLLAGLAASVVSLAVLAAIAARGPGGRRHS